MSLLFCLKSYSTDSLFIDTFYLKKKSGRTCVRHMQFLQHHVFHTDLIAIESPQIFLFPRPVLG